jgi:hypothetical protein
VRQRMGNAAWVQAPEESSKILNPPQTYSIVRICMLISPCTQLPKNGYRDRPYAIFLLNTRMHLGSPNALGDTFFDRSTAGD